MLTSRGAPLNLLLIGILASNQLRAAEITLCKAEEIIVFSCTFTNFKSVSICGSPDAAQSYVEYRFGRTSKIEIKFMTNSSTAHNKFHRGEVVYANNSEDTIWFKNGQFLYSIFMPTRGGPGLEVTRNNDVVARLTCKGGWANVKVERATKSKFITEHGIGDLSKFEPLWRNQ